MEREQNPKERNRKDMVKSAGFFADDFNSDVEENEDLKDDENFPCGFCEVKWAQPANTCVWIKCQICGKWCHALCVGEKAASSSFVGDVYVRNFPLLVIAIASPFRCDANYDI
jgi:hypothetical protein